MISLLQVAALLQLTFHLITSPILLFFSEKIFDYPTTYIILNQNINFEPTKSDTEFLSILGAFFFFIGFIFVICLFSKKRSAMLIISFGQVLIHSQINNILKNFKGVSYILSITQVEFFLGLITITFVISDFILNYDKEKEEEKKKFSDRVEKLKKEYNLKTE